MLWRNASICNSIKMLPSTQEYMRIIKVVDKPTTQTHFIAQETITKSSSKITKKKYAQIQLVRI